MYLLLICYVKKLFFFNILCPYRLVLLSQLVGFTRNFHDHTRVLRYRKTKAIIVMCKIDLYIYNRKYIEQVNMRSKILVNIA